MSRKFLPPGQFGIPSPRTGDFTHADADLLHRIGSQMHVKEARTEGRVPTPISRAFTFYADLFNRGLYDDGAADPAGDGAPAVSPGRADLQAEARRTFRGMLAVFALRETLGLQIAPESITLSPQADALSSVLVPALSTAPGGAGFWNPVRLYTVREGSGPAEVLAGRSPLTGFFPAAKAPRALRGLYWYAPPEPVPGKQDEWARARWQDPTGEHFGTSADPLPIAPATKTKVRQLLRLWLDAVLLRVTMADLQAYGFQARDAASFLKELSTWQDELMHTPKPQGDALRVELAPMLPQAEELPALSFVVRGATAEALLSDLPEQDGRLVLTGRDLREPTRRLYGRTFGHPSFSEALLTSLPAYGDNLGQALRLGPAAIPRPYVLVDRLFAPRLAVLTDGELSAEWSGLAVDMGGVTERALFPFKPEILTLIPGPELESRTRAALTATNDRVAVRLQFGEGEVVQHYSLTGDGAYLFDTEEAGGPGRDTVDLRVFPDFDLASVDGLGLDATDRQYYARVRRLPSWRFDVRPFARDADGAIALGIGREQTRGTFQPPDDKHFAEGVATFFEFDTKPEGFYFTDRGFCLLQLPAVQTDKTPGAWDIGVDFGTSNTCVSVRRGGGGTPDVLDFPIMTTTLLRRPSYAAQDGDTHEGAAAALDFFYRLTADETQLKTAEYFPTQLLTRQERVEADKAFELPNGLIQFYNVSSNSGSWELIKVYPEREVPGTGRALVQPFRSVSDLKWTDTDWLRVFMHHLRKQVVLTAARENARVKQVLFSYPKAFSKTRKARFRSDIKEVWRDAFESSAGPLQLVSESEALRGYAVQGANEYVVFDVGGGTSDLIAFSRGEPVFQTSFRLAAGLINEYVLASQPFRERFIAAYNEAGWGVAERLDDKLAQQFVNARMDGTEDAISQVWLSLLERLGREGQRDKLEHILSILRDEAENGDAVHGFFLTLTLLFSGISYFAGLLLRMADEGEFGPPFQPQEVSLRLAGNGGRLYNLLSTEEDPFDSVIVDLFKRGYGDDDLQTLFGGIETWKGKEAPKVAVALGLLSTSAMDQHDGAKQVPQPIPVANVLGESGYTDAKGQELQPADDLVAYYQMVGRERRAFHVPRQAPPQIRAFLDAADDRLPYGRNGGFAVIPDAEHKWAERLAVEGYQRAIPRINDRVLTRNVPEAGKMVGVPDDERQALEPLFIIELAALLDAIREQHATVRTAR